MIVTGLCQRWRRRSSGANGSDWEKAESGAEVGEAVGVSHGNR